MPAMIASEIWNEIKRFVPEMDRAEVADTIVSVLIDNDIDVEDIKAAFKSDSDIKQALQSYLDDEEEYYEEDLDEDEEW